MRSFAAERAPLPDEVDVNAPGRPGADAAATASRDCSGFGAERWLHTRLRQVIVFARRVGLLARPAIRSTTLVASTAAPPRDAFVGGFTQGGVRRQILQPEGRQPHSADDVANQSPRRIRRGAARSKTGERHEGSRAP